MHRFVTPFATAVVFNALLPPSIAQTHGVRIGKSCQPNRCIGQTADCLIEVGHDDGFGDTLRIVGAWDTIDPEGDAVRIPPTGNLPIVEVYGNSTCTVGGSLPCLLCDAGVSCGGNPSSDKPGGVIFQSDEYVIQPGDGTPDGFGNVVLEDRATVRVQDLCDAPGTQGCSNIINTVQFTAATSLLQCDDGNPCTIDLCIESACYFEPSCSRDSECDDASQCTIDVCEPSGCCSSHYGVAPAGMLFGWGRDTFGEASLFSQDANFVKAAAGEGHSLGLTNAGVVHGWGRNVEGQLNVTLPNTGFVDIAAGEHHSLGLRSSGSIAAWGYNAHGQRNVPSPNSGFTAVAAGEHHSLGLKSDGSIRAWGLNTSGQRNVPAPNAEFIAIAAAEFQSYGLKSDGSIVGWGDNTYGQISIPEPNSGFVAIAAGAYHTLALQNNGTIIAWGRNDFGQIDIPPPNSGFIAIAAGEFHSLGLKSDGSIVGWGHDVFHQSTPPTVNHGIIRIAAGEYHNVAIQGDNPYLTVSPAGRALPREASTAAIAISSSKNVSMPWFATIIAGQDWLTITGGNCAPSSGLAWLSVTENNEPTSRTGTIRVAAPSATPSFRDVTITQAGTAPATTATHLVFAPITGAYSVNEPIPITITAVDANAVAAAAQPATSLNCDLRLTTNSGALLSPNVVQVRTGTWKGSIEADQAYATTIIHGSCNGLSGQSTPFPVLSAQTASLTADVGTPGADVWLTKWNGTRIEPTGSGLRYYQFTGLEAGEYELCATVGKHFAARRQKVFVSAVPVGAAGSTEPFVLKTDVPLYDKRKPPVLFVPGFPGSTEGGDVFPNLTGPLLSPDRSKLKLYGERIAWRGLRTTLESASNVFDVPWDWRAKIDGALVGTYLAPAIDDVLNLCGESPWEKVHIVAHSTGGLVVREYIQNGYQNGNGHQDYRGDIDRFAMCGTPNWGVPAIWYIWDGGDPFTADEVAGDFGGLFPFYERTLANVYSGLTGKPFYENADTSCQAAGPIFADSCDAPKPLLDRADLRNWMRTDLVGSILPDLLPGKPLLLAPNNTTSFPTGHQQTAWWRLNHGVNLDRMADECGRRSGIFAPEGIRTKLFLSTSEETVHRIPIGPPGNGIYLDGQPQGNPIKLKYGDGTILPYTKIQIGLPQISVEASCDGTDCDAAHTDLMSEYREAIKDFLHGSNCGPIIGPSRPRSLGEPPSADPELILSFRGRVQPFVIDPLSNSTGVIPGTSDVVDGIPGSTVSIDVALATIAVPCPSPGYYNVQLSGVIGDVFHGLIEFQTEERHESIHVQGGFSGEPILFTVSCDPNAEHAISVLADVLPPLDVASEESQQLTRIVWTASIDPKAISYRIYGRLDDEPKFTLLGNTTATHFDTGHSWNVAGSAPTWHYFVTAMTADGKESFFTETVQNRHPLVARFGCMSGEADDCRVGVEPLVVNFVDESSGEALAWAWDFDSDGVIDSTEQNPTHTYETPGSYTVTLTVGGPEGVDTSIRPGFIVVEPLDPPPAPVPGDFNGDLLVDLIDFEAMQERWNGPFVDPTVAGWHLFDLDPDYDVDLRDFAHWQLMQTYP